VGRREGRHVRDRLLDDSLRRLAAEAATRLATLVASGDQIPFDVDERGGPGEGLFHSYVPLTGRYVRERAGELRSLPSFESARDAVAEAGVAGAHLEQRGEPVPADPGERAEQLLVVFLASLWDGSNDFAIDPRRIDAALTALDAEAGDPDDGDVVVVPLAGFQMSAPRLRLPRGVRVVRADLFEAPVEAKRSEGMGRASWEPQFLAIAEQGEGSESAAAALRQLRELISVMRLFKPGGVELGPHAFAPTGEGGWRRIATGAPAPRGGGYRLDEAEAEALARLAEALEARPDPAGPLSWAVRRFELGCERATATEGLSDHLLALRAVLGGQGPVGASLPMRAAALVAGGSADRLGARERIEAALELERALMAGARTEGATELASWIEDSVRRILRDAALGELGTDLNEAADETLIATGLDTGDVQIAVSVQETTAPGMPGRAARQSDRPSQSGSSGGSEAAAFESEDMPVDSETRHSPGPDHDLIPSGPRECPDDHAESLQEEHDMDQDTRILEPIPDGDEIRITATDWLEEAEAEVSGSTLDFPAVEGDLERRERIDTPRVRHLFPVPEDADWDVKELDYSHYSRRSA
jgi:hypothetical protein